MIHYFKDVSVGAFTAGFVAVLVGYTSSIAIVFQAAQAFGASSEIIASWMWALGLGMGLCTAIPSLLWRKPAMVAWSTPGAAVLATTALAASQVGTPYNMSDAVGAFMMAGALVALFGVTGWFEKIMHRIPMAIAQALLAGVLARFALNGFVAAGSATGLVVAMLAVYLMGKRLMPRYAVPLTLLMGMIYITIQSVLQPHAPMWNTAALSFSGITWPVFTAPAFSIGSFMSLALPLFIVTMASQNLPGVAAIRASGYDLPLGRLISLTGFTTLLLAPFGGFMFNLSAITAAIVMGDEAHEDRSKRYTAAVSCGLIYVVIGLLGASFTSLLLAFPKELVAAIAGLALLGTIASGLAAAVADERHREAALMTFLVTLSGVVIGGIGSAFWGVAAGLVAMWVLSARANALQKK